MFNICGIALLVLTSLVLYESLCLFPGNVLRVAVSVLASDGTLMLTSLTYSMYVGSHVSPKPSAEFQGLLEGLLAKDATRRLSWSELVVHAFWQGALQHLAQQLETLTDVRESLRQSTANFTNTATVNNRPTTAAVENTSAVDHTDATLGPPAEENRPGDFSCNTHSAHSFSAAVFQTNLSLLVVFLLFFSIYS